MHNPYPDYARMHCGFTWSLRHRQPQRWLPSAPVGRGASSHTNHNYCSHETKTKTHIIEQSLNIACLQHGIVHQGKAVCDGSLVWQQKDKSTSSNISVRWIPCPCLDVCCVCLSFCAFTGFCPVTHSQTCPAFPCKQTLRWVLSPVLCY